MNGLLPDRLVLVSILNWNTAEMTHDCVKQLKALSVPAGVRLQILVIDNGSRADDLAMLQEIMLPWVTQHVELHSQPANLGFAGGTNVALDIARQRNADFVWLVNSDAAVDDPATLANLLAHMDASPRCGAASPQLKLLDPPHTTYFCGAYHDWERRISVRMNEVDSRKVEQERPLDMWVAGTALFLRMAAIAQVGKLDESFFAYYEDDEICTRLARSGWTSEVCYNTSIRHAMPRAETDRPPYYFYLIQRNHLLFWYKNTPAPFRRLLLLKLLDQAFFDVNKLAHKQMRAKADASALGIYDFLRGQFGAPRLDRRVPWVVRQLVSASRLIQRRALSSHFAASTQRT